MVAIIGRFGVGKSLLREYFLKKGMVAIDINPMILSEIRDQPKYALCCACLLKEYDKITEKVPVISDPEVLKKLIEKIMQEKSDAHYNVVILPSFLDVTDIKSIFDSVITVDCSRLVQKRYMQEAGIAERAIAYLLESGFDRNYYKKLGTDVFLNSVSLNHMEWVASQIFRSYKLLNTYK